MLINGQYKESWNILQDVFDYARSVLRFNDDIKEVTKIVFLLKKFERLYPYNLFSSPEYFITKSHCSICGKSMLGINCIHRKGQLYWGEIAIEIIDSLIPRAIAIVKNPVDKRCILELSEKIKDDTKFNALKTFVALNIGFLTDFEIHIKDIDDKIRRNIINPKEKIVLTTI